MRVGNMSSYTFDTILLDWGNRAQNELIESNYEAVRGLRYDMSDYLGCRIGSYVDIGCQKDYLQSFKDSNTLAHHTIEMAMQSLENLTSSKEGHKGALVSFSEALLNGAAGTLSFSSLYKSALSTLQSFREALNATYDGVFIFGDPDKNEPPLKPYEPGAKDNAASAELKKIFDKFCNGKKPEQLTQKDMEKFLESDDFKNMFQGDNWKKYFSNAPDKSQHTKTSPQGLDVDISVSPNEQPFRSAMRVLVAMAEFGRLNLSQGAQMALIQKSLGNLLGESTHKIIDLEGVLGASQGLIDRANKRIDAQVATLQKVAQQMGGVSQMEAAQRSNMLEQSLTLSYQVMARFNHISLANYL